MHQAETYDCSRCGTAFPRTSHHTEIVRRDFVDVPRAPHVDRLCRDCWEAYVADFLDDDFDRLLRTYGGQS